jgi:hypothetical protein
MAVILLIGGWLLLPFGLAKIGSTPSYTLFTSSISVIVFIILFLIVDVKGFSSWAVPIRPAGSNPLLTYILPDIYYAIMGLSHAGLFGDEGWTGVVRAFVFTLFILGVAAIMTRMKIRLQL